MHLLTFHVCIEIESAGRRQARRCREERAIAPLLELRHQSDLLRMDRFNEGLGQFEPDESLLYEGEFHGSIYYTKIIRCECRVGRISPFAPQPTGY